MPRPRLTLVSVLALASLAGGCHSPSSPLAEHKETTTFPAADGKLVRIELTSLDPEILVAAGDSITVEVNLSARAGSRAAAARWVERRRPRIDDSPAALEIRAGRRAGAFFVGSLRTSSQLRVVLPPTCRLEVTTSSGDVRIDGTETLSSPVRVATTSGDVTVRGGVRTLEVKTTSGDLRLSGKELENLQLRSTSGDATVRAPLRSLLADTTSGDLRLEGLTGSLSIQTTSGDVRAEWASLSPDTRIRVGTTSGDVRLRLPSLADLTGELRTRTGNVRTQASGRWERKDRHYVLLPAPPEAPPAEAPPGRAGSTVEVSTRSGDISLRQT
ncbi:MAG: DUF4097 family beta strand repeat protein [Acidobacteriota bacterium]